MNFCQNQNPDLKIESKRKVTLRLIPFINILRHQSVSPRKVLKATLSKIDVNETFDKIDSGTKVEC